MSNLAVSLLIAILAALPGLAVGWLHFRSLRKLAERILDGDLLAVVLQVARFAGLGLFLFLCARLGAAVLLGAAAGILAGRSLVLRSSDSGPP